MKNNASDSTSSRSGAAAPRERLRIGLIQAFPVFGEGVRSQGRGKTMKVFDNFFGSLLCVLRVDEGYYCLAS